MTQYRLNVNPGVDHELSDSEVTDLKAMGFSVTEVDNTEGEGTAPEPEDAPEDEGRSVPARRRSTSPERGA